MTDWTHWLARTIPIGSVGVCAYLLQWGLSRLLALAVPLIVVVTLGHVVRAADEPAMSMTTASGRSVALVSASVVSLTCCVVVAASMSPALGLVVAATALATSPLLWRVLPRPVGTPFGEVVPPVAGMGHLTDTDLRTAWAHTTRELGTTDDPARRLALVMTRQQLLDEAWARDRNALETWVAHGAHARDGTTRYFDPPAA